MRYIAVPVVLGVLAACATLAQARTLHVSPKGDGDTCSTHRPCALATGAQQARRGDVITLAPGDYRSRLELRHDGVTVQGAPKHASRLLWPGGSGGNHILAIRADDLLVKGILIDGEMKAGAGHGLVRFYTSTDVMLQGNRIVRSRGALVSIGGSVPGAKVRNATLFGNDLFESGLAEGVRVPYGEAVYVCSNHSEPKSCTNIEIIANHIKSAGDNFIDLKKSSSRVTIRNNLMERQILRTTTGNHGAIVTQGHGHIIEDNIIRNAEGGTAVLNLASQASIEVTGNVIMQTKGDYLIRTRTGGDHSKTRIEGNWVCDSPKRMRIDKGFVVKGNHGVDLPQGNCGEQATRLDNKRLSLIGEILTPTPTPPLPVIELQAGQNAVCDGPIIISPLGSRESAPPYEIRCQKKGAVANGNDWYFRAPGR